MRSGAEFEPATLKGRRVAFCANAEHAGCWHARMGLKQGEVLRVARTALQKAELVATEGIEFPTDAVEAEPLRVWVKVDSCEQFPQGCEVAVEPTCLWICD